MRFETWLRDRLGAETRMRSGDHEEWVYDCPLCGCARKLYVNAKTSAWCCYRCGEGSKLFARLYALVEGVSEDRAMIALRKYVHIRAPAAEPEARDMVPAPEVAPEEPTLPEELRLPAEYVPICDGDLVRLHPYLVKRRVKIETARTWRLGFCEAGKYRDRIVLPIEHDGELAGFTTRLVVDGDLKYLTPPGLPKQEILYGSQHLGFSDQVVVTEGPFDAILAWQAGVPTVALQGKTMSMQHVEILRGLGVERAVVLLDADDPMAAWAAIRICQFLHPFFSSVTNAVLPDGLDPAECVTTRRPDILKDAIAAAHWPTSREAQAAHARYEAARQQRRLALSKTADVDTICRAVRAQRARKERFR